MGCDKILAQDTPSGLQLASLVKPASRLCKRARSIRDAGFGLGQHANRRYRPRRMPECPACSDGRSWCRPGGGRAGTAPRFWSEPSPRGHSAAPSDRGWWGRKCPWSASPARPRYASGRNRWISRHRPPPSPGCRCAGRFRSGRGREVRLWPRFPLPKPFRRGRRPPRHRARDRPEAARLPDNRSSAWRRRPSPGASATARSSAQTVCLPPAVGFPGGDNKLRHRPFRRQRSPVRQRQRGILVDEAGQGLLAPAPSVDQPEPGLADKADPFGDPGECRGNRRFPGAGQDQRGAIGPGAQLRRQSPLPGDCKPAARQVPDDPGADAGHVIDQRRAQRASPAGRQAGSASAASAPARPYGRARSRRSTYRGRSGSAVYRPHPRSPLDVLNLCSYNEISTSPCTSCR